MPDVIFPNQAIRQSVERLHETERKARQQQAAIADARAGLAHTMYEPLIETIKEFQDKLAADQESDCASLASAARRRSRLRRSATAIHT
ncbi:MAG TPA: hypothetical protein VH165_00105 [Kofleriaceae bacterium]|jgi:hypothetical protein|nr:hypothetical protein [Kofleriaceae bacterium]